MQLMIFASAVLLASYFGYRKGTILGLPPFCVSDISRAYAIFSVFLHFLLFVISLTIILVREFTPGPHHLYRGTFMTVIGIVVTATACNLVTCFLRYCYVIPRDGDIRRYNNEEVKHGSN